MDYFLPTPLPKIHPWITDTEGKKPLCLKVGEGKKNLAEGSLSEPSSGMSSLSDTWLVLV